MAISRQESICMPTDTPVPSPILHSHLSLRSPPEDAATTAAASSNPNTCEADTVPYSIPIPCPSPPPTLNWSWPTVLPQQRVRRDVSRSASIGSQVESLREQGQATPRGQYSSRSFDQQISMNQTQDKLIQGRVHIQNLDSTGVESQGDINHLRSRRKPTVPELSQQGRQEDRHVSLLSALEPPYSADTGGGQQRQQDQYHTDRDSRLRFSLPLSLASTSQLSPHGSPRAHHVGPESSKRTSRMDANNLQSGRGLLKPALHMPDFGELCSPEGTHIPLPSSHLCCSEESILLTEEPLVDPAHTHALASCPSPALPSFAAAAASLWPNTRTQLSTSCSQPSLWPSKSLHNDANAGSAGEKLHTLLEEEEEGMEQGQGREKGYKDNQQKGRDHGHGQDMGKNQGQDKTTDQETTRNPFSPSWSTRLSRSHTDVTPQHITGRLLPVSFRSSSRDGGLTDEPVHATRPRSLGLPSQYPELIQPLLHPLQPRPQPLQPRLKPRPQSRQPQLGSQLLQPQVPPHTPDAPYSPSSPSHPSSPTPVPSSSQSKMPLKREHKAAIAAPSFAMMSEADSDLPSASSVPALRTELHSPHQPDTACDPVSSPTSDPGLFQASVSASHKDSDPDSTSTASSTSSDSGSYSTFHNRPGAIQPSSEQASINRSIPSNRSRFLRPLKLCSDASLRPEGTRAGPIPRRATSKVGYSRSLPIIPQRLDSHPDSASLREQDWAALLHRARKQSSHTQQTLVVQTLRYAEYTSELQRQVRRMAVQLDPLARSRAGALTEERCAPSKKPVIDETAAARQPRTFARNQEGDQEDQVRPCPEKTVSTETETETSSPH